MAAAPAKMMMLGGGVTLPARARRTAPRGHARAAGALRVVGEQKGFGEKKTSKGGAVKRSSRGKVSSQPGLQPSKQQLKQQEDAAAYMAAQAEAKEQVARDMQEAQRAGVPEVVSNRMIKRVITFAGIPMVTGFMLFPLFYYFKVLADPPIDIPNWTAGVASALTFGGAAVGISYGVLSASWNPSIQGTALGFEEFQQNLPIFMKRFTGGNK